MKGNVYWWIEKEMGKLVKQGRYFYQGTIYDGGTPNLFRTKKEAKEFCRYDERPVKVRIEKVR